MQETHLKLGHKTTLKSEAKRQVIEKAYEHELSLRPVMVI